LLIIVGSRTVTGSSRGRPEERRIEITSTYPKGLPHLAKFPDIVLGYDPITNLYVGVDPQRIEHGGPTGKYGGESMNHIRWT
jgi:hypothetical protein